MQPKQKKKSSTAGTIFAVVMFTFFALFQIGKGILVFIKREAPVALEMKSPIAVNKGDYVQTNAVYGGVKYCEFKHSVNFIPVGTEHFFLIFTEDLTQCITVRADKKWGENFENSISREPEGTKVKGYITKLDYKVSRFMEEYLCELNEDGLACQGDITVYIDLLATRYAVFGIVEGLFLLVFMIIVFVMTIKKRKMAEKQEDLVIFGKSSAIKSFFTVVFVILVVVYAMLLVHTISMY